MRRSRLLGIAVPFGLAALVACATEPRGPALIGEFGGVGLGLVATDTAAHLQLACSNGVTEPLRLGDGGTYRASGVWWQYLGGPGVTPWALDLTAGPVGDSGLDVLMVATLKGADTTYTETSAYQLTRGAAPHFGGVICALVARGAAAADRPPLAVAPGRLR